MVSGGWAVAEEISVGVCTLLKASTVAYIPTHASCYDGREQLEETQILVLWPQQRLCCHYHAHNP